MEEFEGAVVGVFQGKIPAVTVDMVEDFRRGTIVRAAVELRVKNVRYEEQKDGTLARVHVFAIEDIDVVSNFSPGQNHAIVTGSSTSRPVPTDEESEELGLPLGRTSDQWPAALADLGFDNVHVTSDGKLVARDTGEVLAEGEEVESILAELDDGDEARIDDKRVVDADLGF